MRTTINLDDQVLAQAKLLAQRTGKTLTDVIEDALRERLARREVDVRREPLHLRIVTGNGLLPGVDLDNSAALRDLLDAAP
jgi:hypothetical protein